MKNPTAIIHVTKETPSEEIAATMTQLATRYVGHYCNKCNKIKSIVKTKACKDCELPWYEARTSMLRILRNIFSLPANRDVPKAIMNVCSQHADDIMKGVVTPEFINALDKLKTFDNKKGWINYLPAEEICKCCGTAFSKRRNQPDDVCVICIMTLKREQMKIKKKENENAVTS